MVVFKNSRVGKLLTRLPLWCMECDNCGTVLYTPRGVVKGAPYKAIVKDARVRGWEVDVAQHKATCFDCVWASPL